MIGRERAFWRNVPREGAYLVSERLLSELVAAVADELVIRLEPRPRELLEEVGSGSVAEPWRLLDLEEAASRLGRSTRWVRERVKRGELATIHLDGGALAFDIGDLRAFADARRVGPGQVSALAGRLHEDA